MDFWMYFGFVYGIFFDGRVPARQSLGRKHSVCLAEVVDFVANPPTKCTKRGTGAEVGVILVREDYDGSRDVSNLP